MRELRRLAAVRLLQWSTVFGRPIKYIAQKALASNSTVYKIAMVLPIDVLSFLSDFLLVAGLLIGPLKTETRAALFRQLRHGTKPVTTRPSTNGTP